MKGLETTAESLYNGKTKDFFTKTGIIRYRFRKWVFGEHAGPGSALVRDWRINQNLTVPKEPAPSPYPDSPATPRLRKMS